MSTTIRSRIAVAFFLFCLGCASTAVPYQNLSEAKQALRRAEDKINEKPSKSDKKEWLIAKALILDGKNALANGKYGVASTLFSTSMAHSHKILRKQNHKD